MYEFLFQALPEAALACRRLYDIRTGGYHLPVRERNVPPTLADVDLWRAAYPTPLFDCIETPVADLLYAVVVNTRSRWILETGTSRGYSTCHLAAGAQCVGGDSARVLTIDYSPAPNPFFAASAASKTITAIQADSLAVDLRPLLGETKLDFMFFDSLHTYAHLSGELARFLPYLKAGGLFALHDTMVYDDLGLVVTWLAKSGVVEALTLPTHRTHGEHSRSPGVTLFRKIDRIEPGDLVFPDLDGVVEGERQSLPRPERVVERTGALFVDARYATAGLHRHGPRNDDQPSLLECNEALRERDQRVDDAWLARLDGFVRMQMRTPLPLQRHRTAEGAAGQAQAEWWRLHGPSEARLYRWFAEPFVPASQRRALASLRDTLAAAAEVAHLACDDGSGPSPLQSALESARSDRPLVVRRLPRDAWRDGRSRLPSVDAYVLDGVLSALSSIDIAVLLERLRDAAPAGACIVVFEPVCFPAHAPDADDRDLAASLAALTHAPARDIDREGVVFSQATRDARALLARRWWGELPCGPAPLQRPFMPDELVRVVGQVFEVRSDAIVQATVAHDLCRELVLLGDDAPVLARRLAVELLPAADRLEAALLARPRLPDVTWYVAMVVAVAPAH